MSIGGAVERLVSDERLCHARSAREHYRGFGSAMLELLSKAVRYRPAASSSPELGDQEACRGGAWQGGSDPEHYRTVTKIEGLARVRYGEHVRCWDGHGEWGSAPDHPLSPWRNFPPVQSILAAIPLGGADNHGYANRPG